MSVRDLIHWIACVSWASRFIGLSVSVVIACVICDLFIGLSVSICALFHWMVQTKVGMID